MRVPPATTRANWERLTEITGREILPIYHAGTDDDWRHFDQYLDDGVTYMALGGMVGQPPLAVMRFVVEAHRRAAGRCVFHGFGLTSWGLIRDLPWYSIDSSTWTQAMRFGVIRLFDRERLDWVPVRIPRWDRERRLYPVTREVHESVWAAAPVLAQYGLTPGTLLDQGDIPEEHWNSWTATRVNPISVAAFRAAEVALRQRHGPIVRPGSELEPGLRVYLAAGATWNPGTHGSPLPTAWGGGLTLTDDDDRIPA